MEINLNWLKSLFTVGRYLWCAAVTNVFIAGLVYTASLAGAQVDAVQTLRDIKQTALTIQEKRDHAVKKVNIDD